MFWRLRSQMADGRPLHGQKGYSTGGGGFWQLTLKPIVAYTLLITERKVHIKKQNNYCGNTPKRQPVIKPLPYNYLVWFAIMGGTLFAWVILNLSVWLLENEEELTLHSNLWDDKWQKEKKREIICLHAEHIWTRHKERFRTLHNRDINCSSTRQIYWSEFLLNALNGSGLKW